MNDSYYRNKEKIYDAEVLESSSLDENIIIKILIRAGRTIAKPALEVLEMALDPFYTNAGKSFLNGSTSLFNNAI